MDNEIVFLFVSFVILAVAVGVIVGNLYLQEGLGEPPEGAHGAEDGSHGDGSGQANHSVNETGVNSTHVENSSETSEREESH